MMNATPCYELEGQHVRKLIRYCLGRCSAMRRDRLFELIGAGKEVIAREVEHMVELGEVEVIRPLSEAVAEERTSYRLVRDTDNDFLWEQCQVVMLPVGRMEDVRDSERRLKVASWNSAASGDR